MRLPRDSGALEALFALVRDYARIEALDASAAESLGLVAEELFTNLVRHNVGGGPTVEVALRRVGPRVELRLRDENVAPCDPGRQPDVDLEKYGRAGVEGGLGLHLVRALTESLVYEHADGALTVTAVLNVEGKDVPHREG